MKDNMRPFILAGEHVYTDDSISVLNKYTEEPIANIALATSDHIEKAICAAKGVTEALRDLSGKDRQDILTYIADRIELDKEEFSEVICHEVGKTIKEARGEVARCIETFRLASQVSLQLDDQVVSLGDDASLAMYKGLIRRVPIGLVSCITPFNFPANLVAHKVAPAIAAGCPFILKPALNTPMSALMIGDIIRESDLPRRSFSILSCRDEDASAMITDDRIKMFTFTGSSKVGWKLKQRARYKRVTLELGGNAACVVEPDVEDLNDLADRLVNAAYAQAGQSCISLQRLYIHQDIYNTLKSMLVERVQKLVVGDPSDASTDVGGLISHMDAERVEQWIKDAVDGGAVLLAGGKKEGVCVTPAILEEVDRKQKLMKEEVFGPVMVLNSYNCFEEVIDEVNDSRYGLQAGVFTQDKQKINKAWDRLEVGGVMINEVPTWRADAMPYGGVKESGCGHEGVKYAVEEMTVPRLCVIKE
ncbi:aldehyde dehydrogenase family protein [Planctomycetota bacterium]|nr:aldehyde dehydrogenase family protein [Planctomycetota bacterium]